MIGIKINNYEIVQAIGEGGMGTVYLARHPFIGRKAAVKVLHEGLARDKSLVARFLNEARAANAIRHPNIIDIIDVGMLAGSETPYLMMEFLEGESLASRLRRDGRLSAAVAVDLAQQTAGALAAAHTGGIIHRDLKPENLYLVPHGSLPGRIVVKVLDFGIAKLRGEISGNQVRTETGALMGTPPYMSPEQCRGVGRDIDHRTDVYALGIILYEMLCGSPPFQASGFGDILVMHLMQPPEPPRARNPDIPEALEALILKALAKTADARFATMAELENALATALRATPIVGGASATPIAGGAVAAAGAAARAVAVTRVPASTPAGATPAAAGGTATSAGGTAAVAGATIAAPGTPGRLVPATPTSAARLRETTTFSSNSGELSADLVAVGARSSRRWLLLGGLLAATGLGAGGFVLNRRSPGVTPPRPDPDPTQQPLAGEEAPAAGGAPAAAGTPAGETTPPPPSQTARAAAAITSADAGAAPVSTSTSTSTSTPPRKRVRPKPTPAAGGPEKW
jgi:eukaryotic-like serine/threonine-protein kinase